MKVFEVELESGAHDAESLVLSDANSNIGLMQSLPGWGVDFLGSQVEKVSMTDSLSDCTKRLNCPCPVIARSNTRVA